MKQELIEELFVEPIKDFANHLNVNGNSRIIFSGPFGSGKSTFLKYFFEDHKKRNLERSNYEYFRANPVSYAVSKNEDIFDYIKYNIILELLKKPDLQINTEDLNTIQSISKHEIEKFFEFLLSIISTSGYDISSVYDKLKELKKEFDLRKGKANEGDSFIVYLKKVEANHQGLYENGIVTQLLVNVLERNKLETGKENVLIIDDIDRLDSDHVFRILNIFSAHFDEELFLSVGRLNKLGFDKVILVFDYHNIKSLFETRYGKLANFNGYIDKFYSIHIFHFDNRILLTDYIKNIILDSKNPIAEEIVRTIHSFGKNNTTIEQLIIEGTLAGHISIRNLKKIKNVSINFKVMSADGSEVTIQKRDNYTVFVIKLFYFLMGDTGNILKLLEYLQEVDYKLKLDGYLLEVIYRFYNTEKESEIYELEGKEYWDLKTEEITYRFSLRKELRTYDVINIQILTPGVYIHRIIDLKHSYILLSYFILSMDKQKFFL